MMNTGDTPHEASWSFPKWSLVKEVGPLFFEKIGPGPIASDESGDVAAEIAVGWRSLRRRI